MGGNWAPVSCHALWGGGGQTFLFGKILDVHWDVRKPTPTPFTQNRDHLEP